MFKRQAGNVLKRTKVVVQRKKELELRIFLDIFSDSPSFSNANEMRNSAIIRAVLVATAIPVIVWTVLSSIVSPNLPTSLTNASVALLIAHPDDEAMFFGPTLGRLALNGNNNNVTIICFSSGDFDGLGEIRKQELIASAGLFGVPESNVLLVDDPERFPDSQAILWNTTLLADEITGLLSPNTKILTFDKDGVSGHANHKAIFEASLIEKKRTGRDLFVLQSLPTWRKYLSATDALVSYVSNWLSGDGSILILSTRDETMSAQSAMTTAHKSQMQWFRYGWIYLSRYMVVNDLHQV